VRVHGSAHPRPGLDIALLFQNPADQLFTNSVEEEVSFGPHNYRTFQTEIHEQTLASADLAHLRGRRPKELRVGEHRKSEIAELGLGRLLEHDGVGAWRLDRSALLRDMGG
jgi:ABC-type hemin transport system ATPase subunit